MDIRVANTPPEMADVSVELAFVTPEMAAEWLANKMPNRNVQAAQVGKIQRDVRAGNWTITHQGIAFNSDGRLYDGQNRLTAISGLEGQIDGVWMMVFRGFQQKAMAHTDGQRPRSFQNFLQIHGKEASLRAASVVKLIENLPSATPARYSREEEMALWDRYGHAASFATSVSITGLSRGPACAIARAFLCGEDRDRLREFQEILKTGLTASSRDFAAITLRNYLLKNSQSGSMIEVEKYRKTQSALRAFLDGASVTKLYGTERDLFPIPDKLPNTED